MQPRWLGARRCARKGASPPVHVDARDRTQNRGGESSGGREPQESTDGLLRPGQVTRVSRNGLPGGAKLRSGRAGRQPASPALVGSGRYVRRTSVRRGDRPSDRRDPPSRLMRPGSASGRARAAKSRLGTRVKAVAKTPQALRRRQSENEPASEQEARESGYGSPGRESSGGALQGRGRHETRPSGVERPGEGVEPLVPHGRPQGSSRGRRATRRGCVRGSKNLRRGSPAPASREVERAETRLTTLERNQPHEGSPRSLNNSAAQGSTRKTPRSSRTTRGERRKPARRYSTSTTRP